MSPIHHQRPSPARFSRLTRSRLTRSRMTLTAIALTLTGLTAGAFAPAAATRKMCAPAIMDQEQKFFDALGTVTSWRLENGILHLTGKEGAPAIRLAGLKNSTDIVIRLPGPEQSVARETISYECDADQRVVAEYINAGANSLAVLKIGEETIIAANVMAGSGAKYAGGRYEWWTKGDEATLELIRPLRPR